jgi:serine/threonine-protein kinase RsbW
MPLTEDGFNTYRLPARREHIHDLCAFALSNARLAGASEEKAFELEVIMEEVLSNIADHAYKGRSGDDDWVEVGINCSGDGLLRLRIEDAGIHFDALTVPPPDMELPLLEREIGGLGIHLFRQLAQNHRYERTAEGTNRLYFDLPAR